MSGTRRKPGRMGPFIDGFEVWLLESGYTPGTVRNALMIVGQIGRWMTDADVEVSQLNEASIGVFRIACRARGLRCVPGARAFTPLLDYLRVEGVLMPELASSTPVDEVLNDYRTWLVDDRGLAAPTVLRYENLACRFLSERVVVERHVR